MGMYYKVHSLFTSFTVDKRIFKGALPVAVKFKSGVLIYFSALVFHLESKGLPGLQFCFHK